MHCRAAITDSSYDALNKTFSMQRVAFKMKLKKGFEDEYQKRHYEIK